MLLLLQFVPVDRYNDLLDMLAAIALGHLYSSHFKIWAGSMR